MGLGLPRVFVDDFFGNCRATVDGRLSLAVVGCAVVLINDLRWSLGHNNAKAKVVAKAGCCRADELNHGISKGSCDVGTVSNRQGSLPVIDCRSCLD